MATISLRLGPADHGRALTLQEFMDADEEPGYRYELARGVLEVTEVPNDPHGMIVCFFYQKLTFCKQEHPNLILRFGGASEYRLWMPGMASGRNPDVAVTIRGKRLDTRRRRPPSLVVEVVSPGTEAHDRDYITKREEYLAFGLDEYWIVDRFAGRVTVLLRDGDVWVERVFDGDSAASGLVLPGFAVRLADLWDAAAQADVADDEDEPEAPGA